MIEPLRWGPLTRAGGAARLLQVALTLLCCAAPAFAAEGEREVTLAVVAADAELAPLAALLEVRLSQEGVRLVERAEVDRVLQEQELGAAGLAERDALVKLGRLLRADAFLLLSVEAKPKEQGGKKVEGLLRVRLAETVHGIRLLDSYAGWDPEKVEEAAGQVAGRVASAAAKLALPPGELVPVGIVDIHRVLLGEERQWVCRALKTMLSARLSREPRIVVLEREDLKLLMGEKELTAGERDAFWRSGVLVEGTLRRSGRDGMELALQLKRAGGEASELAPIVVDVEQLAQAAERAAGAVLGQMADAPLTGTWDPAQEAEEFSRQGNLLKAHRRNKAALPLLETAFALAPGDVQYGIDLFSSAATRRPWPGKERYTDLQEAELAGRLAALVRRRKESGHWGWPEKLLTFMLERHVTGQASTSSERVIELNRPTRQAVVELSRVRLGQLSQTQARRSVLSTWAVRLVVMRTSSAEEAVRAIKEFVGRKIMPPQLGGTTTSFTERCDVGIGFAQGLEELLRTNWAAHVFFDDYEFPNKLFPYFQELAKSDDPLVRFAGCMLCTSKVKAPVAYGMPKWNPPVDQDSYLDQAIEVFDQHLRARPDVSAAAAGTMRTMLSLKVLARRSSEQNLAFMERFYTPLIEQGDVDGLLSWPIGTGTRVSEFWPGRKASPETSARYVALIDRAAEALEPHAAREDVADQLSWIWFNSDHIKDGLRRHLRGRGAGEVGRYLPELLRAPDRMVRVKMLLRQSDWFTPWPKGYRTSTWMRTFVQGSMLWVATVGKVRDWVVGLAAIDMRTGAVPATCQTVIPTKVGGLGRCEGLAIGTEKSYLAFRRFGLVEFPGTDATGRAFLDQPRVLGEKDGLPPGSITGVAPHEDKLWIGYKGEGGSGLGLYNPRTGDWETVFDSTKRGETPLESGVPYSVRELTPVAGSLLFVASGGVWRLRPGSNTPESLCKVSVRVGCRLVDSPGGPWVFGMSALARLDLDRQEVQLLMADRYERRGYKPRGEQALSLVSTPFVQGRAEANPTLFPVGLGALKGIGAAVHGDELWAPYGETQIIILRRGKSIKDAEFIPNDILDGKKVIRFLSTPYGLIAIGEGSVGLVEPGA